MLWAILGLLLGLLLSMLFARRVAYVIRGLRLRRMMKNRPPMGTRPEVGFTYEDVTYELTDDLVRVTDNELGWARWAAVGPPHLLLPRTVKPIIRITKPVPLKTEVSFCVVACGDGWCRFMTVEEITEQYPKPWPA